MGKSKIKIALLFLTVYSFFIAFIFVLLFESRMFLDGLLATHSSPTNGRSSISAKLEELSSTLLSFTLEYLLFAVFAIFGNQGRKTEEDGFMTSEATKLCNKAFRDLADWSRDTTRCNK